MARDCIFYSEDKDMGATIPFCNFEDSSDWVCCKHYDPRRGSTQELCPHYISRKDGLEMLRRTESRTTRREKWLKKVPDRYIEATICDASRHLNDDCPDCPIKKMCMDYNFGNVNAYDKYLTAVSKWLNEEVKDDQEGEITGEHNR